MVKQPTTPLLFLCDKCHYFWYSQSVLTKPTCPVCKSHKTRPICECDGNKPLCFWYAPISETNLKCIHHKPEKKVN